MPHDDFYNGGLCFFIFYHKKRCLTRGIQFSNLINTIDNHLSEGGTWQHLSGNFFVLFNEQILDIDLSSYNDRDSKCLRRWITIA